MSLSRTQQEHNGIESMFPSLQARDQPLEQRLHHHAVPQPAYYAVDGPTMSHHSIHPTIYSPPLSGQQSPPSHHDPQSGEGPAAFCTLPPELHIRIFQNILAPQNMTRISDIQVQRTRLLLVCRYVRSIIMATPMLWTHVSIAGPSPNYASLDRHLELAQGAALCWLMDTRNDVSTDDSSQTSSSEAEYLSEQWAWCTPEVLASILQTYVLPKMHQTLQLHILYDTLGLIPTLFTHLRSTPAPLLVEFKIANGNLITGLPLHLDRPISRFSSQILDDLFMRQAPRLEVVQLHYLSVSYTLSILTSMRAFQTMQDAKSIQLRSLDLSLQGAMPPDAFYESLKAVGPNLQSLILRYAGPGYEVARAKAASPVVHLPRLRNLTVGGMTAEYLEWFLQTLHLPPLESLGIHNVDWIRCDSFWTLLSQHRTHVDRSLPRPNGSPESAVFTSIKTLELSDVSSSYEMMTCPPTTQFQAFLQAATALTEIRMRKISIEYLNTLVVDPAAAHEPLAAPVLERLEVCGLLTLDRDVEGLDSLRQDMFMARLSYVRTKLKVVTSTLLAVIRSRLALHVASHSTGTTKGLGIRRLHLDGEEWGPRATELLQALKKMTEDIVEPGLAAQSSIDVASLAPLVQWDANCPFFMDYYDTMEF